MSCLGADLAKEVLVKQIPIKKISSNVRTADRSRQDIMGVISLQFSYTNEEKVLEFYIIPSRVQNLYLGVGFWKVFGIATNVISEITVSEVDLNSHIFTEQQQRRLQSAISCFPKFEEHGLGKTTLVEHAIDVGYAKPIKQRHFPMSPAVEKLMCEEIDTMLALGVIEESSSPWSSPVVLVRKPGKVRLCLDSRKVNALTVKDATLFLTSLF